MDTNSMGSMQFTQGSSVGSGPTSRRSQRQRKDSDQPLDSFDMDLDDKISVRSWDQSVYSYNDSRDSSNFLRAIQGRIFNKQNSLYFLPADETEWNRLDKQHLMLLLLVGSLVAVPQLVHDRLATEPGVRKSVLDLGTGGGNWAISMAHEFPDVDVVGVDLAPSTTRPPPDNCRFEFDDVNLGLPHYYGKFDVVHARSAANGLPKYEDFITECGRCLKPGGILLLVEGEFQLYDIDLRKVPVPVEGDEQNPCWYQRLLFEAYHVMKVRGSSMDAGYMMSTYLGRNTWFENVGSQTYYSCNGPWQLGNSAEESQKRKMIGTLMRQNSMEFFRSLRPLFISAGYPEDVVEKWIERSDTELAQLRHRIYTRWHYAWATIKPDHPAKPVDPLPVPPSPYDTPWPVPDVYIDKEKLMDPEKTL